MNQVRVLWQELTPDAHALLQSIQNCFEVQAPTGTWTEERRMQAKRQTLRLLNSWNQQRIDLDSLWTLRTVTADLDLAGTLTCRAALEAIHGHFQRLVELTAEVLALEE